MLDRSPLLEGLTGRSHTTYKSKEYTDAYVWTVTPIYVNLCLLYLFIRNRGRRAVVFMNTGVFMNCLFC